MRSLNTIRFICLIFPMIFLVSCGSGGSSSTTTPMSPTITQFALHAESGGQIYNGIISESSAQIFVVIPQDVADSMIATYTTEQVTSVLVNNVTQTSNQTVNTFSSESDVVYTVVANDGTRHNYTITRLDPIPGSLTPLNPESIDSGGIYPNVIAVHPNGKFVYVANNSGTVSMFRIESVGESAGVLVPLTPESTVNPNFGPFAVAITPDGKYAYVSNSVANTISMYSIESSGESAGMLVPLESASQVNTEGTPTDIAITQDSQFLYVLNLESDSISMFRIESIGESAGVLVPLSTTSVPSIVDSPISIAVTPMVNGEKFVYVTSLLSDVVAMFKIESSGENRGLLTVLTPSFIDSGGGSFSVIVYPNGQFAYVSDSTNSLVRMFNINNSDNLGELSPMNPPFVPTPENYPIGMAIDPSGKFAYVATSESSGIAEFAVESTSGAMSPLSANCIGYNKVINLNPFKLAITPDGRYLYTTNINPNRISMFKITQ